MRFRLPFRDLKIYIYFFFAIKTIQPSSFPQLEENYLSNKHVVRAKVYDMNDCLGKNLL